jgi:DNA-binding transcriptional regulator GbsR (MarR family)
MFCIFRIMSTWQERFTQALGDAASRSGVFSELGGRIFGALYLSPSPLSLDDICDAVRSSKGNVSTQVRELVDLGLARRVQVRPGRRHYYEAATDLWQIATEVIGRRLEQETRTLLRSIEGIELEDKPDPVIQARMTSLRVFMQLAISMLEAFRRGDMLKAEALKEAGS